MTINVLELLGSVGEFADLSRTHESEIKSLAFQKLFCQWFVSSSSRFGRSDLELPVDVGENAERRPRHSRAVHRAVVAVVLRGAFQHRDPSSGLQQRSILRWRARGAALDQG